MTLSKTDDVEPMPLHRLKLFVAILSVVVALVLLSWSLLNYQPVKNPYGPRAIYSLVLLSITLALFGRISLLRFLRSEMRAIETAFPQEGGFVAGQLSSKVDDARFVFEQGEKILPGRFQLRERWKWLLLFDVAAPLYLAAAVLIDVPAAVIIALITQILLQSYTCLRGFVSWMEACYRVASIALVAFLTDTVYAAIGGPKQVYLLINQTVSPAESRELLGSVLGTFMMLVLIVLVSFPLIMQVNRLNQRAAWREYLLSPALRFQFLVLSVGPLIPVVDIFDDTAAELAWLFFLIPLFAIYYLALTSTRLSIRTNELQRTLQDLSSSRRRQGELRDYATLITRVQEEERHRLARELHDDTAQALIALSLGLDGLGRAMQQEPLSQKDLQWFSNLQNLADATLEGVRRACRDLRPSVLDDLGLRAALEWLSDSSAARGVPCSFTCTGHSNGESNLLRATTPEAEIAVFRIVQEALSNIWRHSQATQASLELSYYPDLLQVTICDNGQGFASDQQDSDPHLVSLSGLGLLGMRERATLIGAHLLIASAPTQGCKVVLTLPLQDRLKPGDQPVGQA